MTISESPVMASASGERFVDGFVGAVGELWSGARSSAIEAFDPSARIAIVRGFDKGSRNVRAALAELARTEAGGFVDVAPVPSFGQIPAAEHVGLVVVTRDSLLAGAQRCAAYWGARVIAADTLLGGGELVEEQCFALRVNRGDVADTVTSGLYLDGEVDIDGARHSRLTVEPATDGVLLGDQVVRGPITAELENSTMGGLDGEPQMFAKGGYEITGGASFRRLGPAA